MPRAERKGESLRSLIAAAKTVVVKVGSSLVTAGGTGLDATEIAVVEEIANQPARACGDDDRQERAV